MIRVASKANSRICMQQLNVAKRRVMHYDSSQNGMRKTLRSKSTSSKENQSHQASKPSKPPTESPTPSTSHIEIKAFSIGTVAGICGSLVGLGGGFIMIPLMTSPAFLGLKQHAAHGTSLFAVTTTGIAGGLSYFQENRVDFYSAISIAVSGMITARLGAKFSNKLSQKQLKKVLGTFMILISPVVPLKPYLESIGKSGPQAQGEGQSENQTWKIVGVSSCIGLFSGFMAGLLGVGGGAIVVPALTLFTPMDHYTALGTSLSAMGLPAMVGTLTHFKAGNLHSKAAPFLALGSFVGAYGGGMVGVKINEDTLRAGFSGLMITLGVRTLIKA